MHTYTQRRRDTQNHSASNVLKKATFNNSARTDTFTDRHTQGHFILTALTERGEGEGMEREKKRQNPRIIRKEEGEETQVTRSENIFNKIIEKKILA